MTRDMTQIAGKKITATLAAAALGVLALGATASAGEYYVPANAPITYKMADPGLMQGYAPQFAQPQMQAPLQGIARPVGPAATFDQSRIDRTLYAHQKVGTPYTVMGQTYSPAHDPMYDMVGTASWYGDKFHGKMTANGEIFDKTAMTAAHKTLPLGSLVIVTNIASGQSLTLRINDRGPFVGNRIIDLSEAAAHALGYKTTGLGDVRVQYAGPAAPVAAAPQQQTYTAPQATAPQYVAPAPQQLAEMAPAPSAPQTYQPLRSLPEQFAPQMPAPQAPVQQQPQPQHNMPGLAAPVMPQTMLPQAPIAIPQAHAENNMAGDDTLTTLTISGPVHMARYNDSQPKARVIPAVYKTDK